MNVNFKGSLQEYCQRRYLPPPKYDLVAQSGLQHCPRFQVEIRIGNKCFIGEKSCLTKKEAEQSAAKVAYKAMLYSEQQYSPERPSRPQRTTIHDLFNQLTLPSPTHHQSMKHMPPQYADSEDFVNDAIRSHGGRIRKIWPPDEQGKYQFEITGTYRYCENVEKHHRKNHIYFLVDPVQKTYCQKCHDPGCTGFQSDIKTMSTHKEHVPIKRNFISSTNDFISAKRDRRRME